MTADEIVPPVPRCPLPTPGTRLHRLQSALIFAATAVKIVRGEPFDRPCAPEERTRWLRCARKSIDGARGMVAAYGLCGLALRADKRVYARWCLARLDAVESSLARLEREEAAALPEAQRVAS